MPRLPPMTIIVLLISAALKFPRPTSLKPKFCVYSSAAVLLEHVANLYRRAALALAFIGSFHEGEEFDGFLRGYRSNAGLEKLDDFTNQRRVIATGFLLGDAFGPKDHNSIRRRPFAQGVQSPHPAAGPDTRDDIRIRSAGTHHGFTAGAEDSEQRLGRMHSIPKEVGMMRLV